MPYSAVNRGLTEIQKYFPNIPSEGNGYCKRSGVNPKEYINICRLASFFKEALW